MDNTLVAIVIGAITIYVGYNFYARRIDRKLVIAVVDACDHVAGAYMLVVLDSECGDIAADDVDLAADIIVHGIIVAT